MRKKIEFNTNETKLTSKGRLIITEVGNKVERQLSDSFTVVDILKVSIRDIEGNDYMYYHAPDIKEPKFNDNTPIELQKIIIDAYLFQKQNNGFLYTTMVDVKDLWPAMCQRTLNLKRVNDIANHFSTYQFTPVKLVYLDGKMALEIEDGQHHAAAAKALNISKVPCTIAFGKTEQQVAEDFESQNDYTKKLSQIEKYEAGLKAGYIDCITMDKVCNLFRIKLAGNSNEYPKTIHSIRAVKRIVRDYGEEGLKFVFQMLIDAGWEHQTKAYEESAINIGYGVLELINANKGEFNYEKLIQELSSYDSVVDCLKAMETTIGSYAINKHPEQTPKIYLNLKYGK